MAGGDDRRHRGRVTPDMIVEVLRGIQKVVHEDGRPKSFP